MSTTKTDTARVYVADLSAYNGGRLRGVWIDIEDTDPDTYGEAIAAMLAGGEPGAEEWRVDDYEGMPRSVAEGGAEAWAAYAEIVEEHGADLARAADDFGTYDGREPWEWGGVLEDAIMGRVSADGDESDAVAEWGFETEQLEIPKHLSGYAGAIYDAWASSLVNGGEMSAVRLGGNEWVVFSHR